MAPRTLLMLRTNSVFLSAVVHLCGGFRAAAKRHHGGAALDPVVRMLPPKRFVYILKSLAHPDEYYVGVTSNPGVRLQAHNSGLTSSTSEHRPWRMLVSIEFDEEEPALKFERYLKTGSGREFARRHFRQTVQSTKRPKRRHGNVM